MSTNSGFSKLLNFLQQLHEKKVSFYMNFIRPDTVCVDVFVPGQIWEVEFFSDGRVDIQVFRTDGDILNEESLRDLWTLTE